MTAITREYNVADAAAELGISEATVYEWLKTGQLAGFKRGGKWVIRGTALAACANEKGL